MRSLHVSRVRPLALTLVVVSLLQVSLWQSQTEQLQASIFGTIHDWVFGSSSSSVSSKPVVKPKPAAPTAPASSATPVVVTPPTPTVIVPYVPPVPVYFTVQGYRFPRTIRTGMKGDDVLNLQLILNRNPLTQMAKTGVESPGQETATYDYKTRIALIAFQKLNFITDAQKVRLHREQGVAGLTTRQILEKIAKELVAQGKLPSDTTNLHAAAQAAASSLRMLQSSFSSRSHASVASTGNQESASSTTTTQISSTTSQASTASTASTVSTASQASSAASTQASTSTTSTTSAASTSKSSAKSAASVSPTLNCGTGPTIHLSASCLTAATQPYILDQANATYILDTDVNADGSAFMMGNANVTLDLNGHTVTYGNGAVTSVPNGGFENGTTGWDVSGAPTATIKPAPTGMWGANALFFSNYSAIQTIVSSPISIPVANREYAVTVTGKGGWNQAIEIQMIDTVTGQNLPMTNVNRASVDRGYGRVESFMPTTTNPVKMQIQLIPNAAAVITQTFLDYAQIFPLGDYGVIASPSSGQLPVHLQTTEIKAAAKRLANGPSTIKNGSLLQGKAHAYGSNAINALSTKGISVSNVTAFVNGMDSINLNLQWGTTASVLNSTFDSDIDNISDRQKIFNQINVSATSGNIRIEGNTLTNSPQVGIFVGKNTGGFITIKNNTISQRAVVSNPYAILLYAVSNFLVADNRITPIWGRGISLDGSQPTHDGEVYGNYVESRMRPNIEYTFDKMSATPLRIRNWGNVQSGIHIHDNTFIAMTGDPGTVWVADGAFVTMQNDDPNVQNPLGGNLIENNIFKAIVTTTDKAYKAWGMTISGVAPGAGLLVKNNILESNDISLNFGDDDNWQGIDADILFLQNTFKKSNEGAARDYTPMLAGDGRNTVTKMRIIDPIYTNGAAFPGVRFIDIKTKDIGIGYLLTVNAVPNASVEVKNAQGTVIFTGTTDSSGTLNAIPLISTTYSQIDPKVLTPIITNNAPLQITVSGNGKTVTQSTNLTQNTTLTFNLQ